jgi:general stress protein 26
MTFDAAVREFLKNPYVARMSTIDENGYPHTVPLWFDVDGDDLVVMGERRTRKTGHIKANPKGSLSIGGGTGEIGGYLFKGEFTLEEDPEDYWMQRITRRYEPNEEGEKHIVEWTALDIIVYRLHVQKVSKTA